VLDSDGAPGTVTIGAPSHRSYVATYHGRAAHAGVRPEAGVSAIECAAAAVAAMELGRLDDQTTANVGTITGGVANNVVPDTCTVTGEFRSFSPERLAAVEAQITQALLGAVNGKEATVEIAWETNYLGFLRSVDDPLVQLALTQASDLGLPAHTALTGGGSDANIYANRGLQVIVLGTGMQDIHGLHEKLAVKDLENLSRLAIALTYAYGICYNSRQNTP
jgi:tripeptide aminopeptidase